MSYKYSVLTFIFGGYENLKEPGEISPDCEYILVTDDKTIVSKNWKIKYLPEFFDDASNFTKSFYVRYHPFEFVSTDTCIVIDGSIKIEKNLNTFISDFWASKSDISLSSNVVKTNPILEYDYWVKSRHYPKIQATKNLAMLHALGYTEKYKGAFETGFIIYTNTNKIKEFCETTYEILVKLGNEKNVDRLDQSIVAALIAGMFKDLKVFNVTRQILQSSYLNIYWHNSNKKRTLSKLNLDNVWFRNKKIKPYILN